MGSGLLLVVIPALLVFGVVVLMTAIIYGTSDKPRADRERRPEHERWKRQGQDVSPRGSAVRDRAARQGTPLVTMTYRWWLEVRHHALDARVRWLTLESTTGQVIAAAAVSVLAACLLFATMG